MFSRFLSVEQALNFLFPLPAPCLCSYAFCYMEHKQAALNTLAEAETLTGLQLNGRKLIVQKARGSGREAAEGEGAVHGRCVCGDFC